MRVLAHDPTFSHADDCAAPVSLEELLRGSDVLSLHCPLTPSTEGAIDAPALQQMKPSSILINTARGPIVDLDALHEALRTETIGGAALDVFSIEPPPNHPLLAAWRAGEEWIDGRLVLSPHAAYYSPEAVDGLRREATEAAVRFLTEGTLRHCVNKQLLPQ
jgi:phosphoglycerate dehydrogenase-like enzyme